MVIRASKHCAAGTGRSQRDIYRSRINDSAQREILLEQIRSAYFPNERSRLVSIFAANTIHEAEEFGRLILPVPKYDLPIYELFAGKFAFYDMSWLDYVLTSDHERNFHNLSSYWERRITTHVPQNGARSPPRIEASLALPVTVGKLVSFVNFSG